MSTEKTVKMAAEGQQISLSEKAEKDLYDIIWSVAYIYDMNPQEKIRQKVHEIEEKANEIHRNVLDLQLLEKTVQSMTDILNTIISLNQIPHKERVGKMYDAIDEKVQNLSRVINSYKRRITWR